MSTYSFSLLATFVLLFGLLSSSIIRYDYIRPTPQCNKHCTSKTPIAGMVQCCKAAGASNFGFCTKHNQALCAAWTEEYTVIWTSG
ncbi:unnamed protein product, partial [Mesorhabditis belari]|uniref:Uncharacterized protein n=1 Tax=Mesorhabditis belari TaxID=2138241 RepID=A0AAF3EU38_9BILA